jgi:hypothetical protein
MVLFLRIHFGISKPFLVDHSLTQSNLYPVWGGSQLVGRFTVVAVVRMAHATHKVFDSAPVAMKSQP